jgi:hypothetical protein
MGEKFSWEVLENVRLQAQEKGHISGVQVRVKWRDLVLLMLNLQVLFAKQRKQELPEMWDRLYTLRPHVGLDPGLVFINNNSWVSRGFLGILIEALHKMKTYSWGQSVRGKCNYHVCRSSNQTLQIKFGILTAVKPSVLVPWVVTLYGLVHTSFSKQRLAYFFRDEH